MSPERIVASALALLDVGRPPPRSPTAAEGFERDLAEKHAADRARAEIQRAAYFGFAGAEEAEGEPPEPPPPAG